jgi:hypothetical protein
MKPESFQALLLDRELGELSAEAVELLDAWLTEHPEAAQAIPYVRRTCATIRTAVQRFPELVRPESNLVVFPARRFRVFPLALAASLLVLLGGTAWLGFRAGQGSVPSTVAASYRESATASPARAITPAGPWARYRLVSDPHGGLRVVSRDHKPAS